MLTFLILLPVLIVVSVISLIVRLIFGSIFWFPRHRSWRGYGPYGCGYGYRRHRFGWWGPLALFVVLERLFDRRY
jgi:hypothetical protein